MHIKKNTFLEGVYIFIYTLHFSLVHSQTVVGALHVIHMLSVFFDQRCENVTYIYVTTFWKTVPNRTTTEIYSIA